MYCIHFFYYLCSVVDMLFCVLCSVYSFVSPARRVLITIPHLYYGLCRDQLETYYPNTIPIPPLFDETVIKGDKFWEILRSVLV